MTLFLQKTNDDLYPIAPVIAKFMSGNKNLLEYNKFKMQYQMNF